MAARRRSTSPSPPRTQHRGHRADPAPISERRVQGEDFAIDDGQARVEEPEEPAPDEAIHAWASTCRRTPTPASGTREQTWPMILPAERRGAS